MKSFAEDSFTEALAEHPRPFRSVAEIGLAMRRLMGAGLATLPLPGGGETLARWRALAGVGAVDLSLAKIYEGHTDAVAIAAELGGELAEGLGAVWAAEPPGERVIYRGDGKGGTLSGRKPWCSGAAVVDYGLVSAWTENGDSVLVHVTLRQPGVTVSESGWDAVGMAATESVPVVFNQASARRVGEAGDYVARPGFWQGGAGIAAVWYGGAKAIAQTLAESSRIGKNPHVAAHLGAVDTALRSARALFVETSAWIDDHPRDDAAAAALRLRAAVEQAANEVLWHTGRALGAAPLCSDAAHAQRCADLPVFLRQSHAESDLAALGGLVAGDSLSWHF